MKKYMFFFVITLLFFVGCAGPRSESMCLNYRDNWVKCPKGYQPGETLQYNNKGQVIAK